MAIEYGSHKSMGLLNVRVIFEMLRVNVVVDQETPFLVINTPPS